MTQMNPAVKEKWIAALRSGEYRQGQGFLRRPTLGAQDAYCCLGVLCELAVQEGVVPAGQRDDLETAYRYGDEGEFMELPEVVSDWSGVSTSGMFSNGQETLTVLNDALEYSFDQLAEVIEREF